MFRLTGVELYKIWGKKMFWGVLAILLFLNVFLLWYHANVNSEFAPEGYRLMTADLKGLSEAEKEAFIRQAYEGAVAKNLSGTEETPRYMDNYAKEETFLLEIYDEIRSVEGYQEVLDDIADKAQNLSAISIFQGEDNTGFSSRNIVKTAADFEKMRSIEICYESSQGFVMATDFLFTDILLIGALFIIGSILIFDEKKKDMFSVIRVTSKGRSLTIGAKVAAMSLSACFVTILFFTVNFLMCHAMFGLGNLGRSLQSNEPFLRSILPVSVGQYLGIFIILKWAGAFLVGALILLLALLCANPIFALLGMCGLYGAGFLLYAWIPPTSPMNLLRYCNPTIILCTNRLYMQYLNFNVFGYPVNMVLVIAVYLGFVIGGLLVSLFLVYAKKKSYRARPLPAVIAGISMKLPIGHSLYSHETYKILVRNKGMLFLLFYLVIMLLQITAKPVYLSSAEIIYSSYMHNLSGDMDEQKRSDLEEEQESYEEARKQVEKIDQMRENGEINILEANELKGPYIDAMNNESIFEAVLTRVSYVDSHKGAKMLYDSGYKRLLLSDADESQALIMILVFVLLFSPVFGAEYKNNTIKIMRTTPLGREQTTKVKLKLTLLLSVILSIMYIIPQLVRIGKSYGFPGLYYPAISIPQYAWMPSWMPVILIIVLHFAIQVLAMAGMALILCLISQKLKNVVFSLLAGAMIFGVPVLLTAMGLGFAKWFSILPLLEM